MSSHCAASLTNRERDLALLERLRRGESRAFDELVLPYRRGLFLHVLHVVKDPNDAADIMQDAMVSVFRGVGSFRGDCCVYTWMYRIAINSAFKFLARRKRRMAADVAEDARQGGDTPEFSHAADPANVLAGKQMAEIVEAALEAMRPEYKKAIVLWELDGLSYSQIADVMVCPVGTVKSRISSARQVIATKLRRGGFTLPCSESTGLQAGDG